MSKTWSLVLLLAFALGFGIKSYFANDEAAETIVKSAPQKNVILYIPKALVTWRQVQRNMDLIQVLTHWIFLVVQTRKLSKILPKG